MKKLLIEYRWFQKYHKEHLGIHCGGRTYLPTRRRVNSCEGCLFRPEVNVFNRCSINVERELDRGMTACFPCKFKSTSTKFAEANELWVRDALLSKIFELCEKEDREDAVNS